MARTDDDPQAAKPDQLSTAVEIQVERRRKQYGPVGGGASTAGEAIGLLLALTKAT